MPPKNQENLKQRAIHAAETALAMQSYVSPIDVLVGMNLLSATHVKDWKSGRVDFLELVIQANLKKISFVMSAFRQWALSKQLKPNETRYVGKKRAGMVDLQFSKSGNPAIEKHYRTHYVSPALSEQRRRNLEELLTQAPETVVFQIVQNLLCSKCRRRLPQDTFVLQEAGEPVCLPCAHLDDLAFLPTGNPSLTKRSAKHSKRTAQVMRFSATRGQFERVGILVEKAALEKAEG